MRWSTERSGSRRRYSPRVAAAATVVPGSIRERWSIAAFCGDVAHATLHAVVYASRRRGSDPAEESSFHGDGAANEAVTVTRFVRITTTTADGKAGSAKTLSRARYFVVAGVELNSNGYFGDRGDPNDEYPAAGTPELSETSAPERAAPTPPPAPPHRVRPRDAGP